MKHTKNQLNKLQEFALTTNDLAKVNGGLGNIFTTIPATSTLEQSRDGGGVDLVIRNHRGQELSRYCIQTPDLSIF